MQAVCAYPVWLSLSHEAIISRVELIESLFAQLSVVATTSSSNNTLGRLGYSSGLAAGAGWDQCRYKASRLILSCPKVLVASTDKVRMFSTMIRCVVLFSTSASYILFLTLPRF